ncbi:MAG: hypothetical protein MJ171_00020 [Clostridia bacterium]|nr:hypothetical protein [Clostridia bacterium]
MGKIMEAVFCVIYLILTTVLGIVIIKKSEGRKNDRLFGIMTLTLVFGDSFHLVPRILAALNPAGDYHVSLGLGKMVTSITMTIFYLILYLIYEKRYNKECRNIRTAMIVLSVLRIALCLLPQNDWTGSDPLFYGILRNIPFTIMGIIMVVLFYKERKDRYYRFMWIAILLSFAFYLPVVLFSDVSPMIGMLMMPKTCMYVWMVVMGLKQVKNKG